MESLRDFLSSRGVEPSMRAFLERDRVRAKIVGAIPRGPRGYGPLIEQVIESTAERPLVLECDPTSVVGAIRRAARWELRIGQKAYVIPRRNPDLVTWSLTAYQGYRGKMELLERHRVVEHVSAGLRYSHETFAHEEGTTPYIKHLPIDDIAKRGELVSAYAWALRRNARHPRIVVMHRSEIDRIRTEYSADWSDGDLETLLWYPVRTCVHRLTDLLNLPLAVQHQLDDEGDDSDSDTAASEPDAKPVVASYPNDPYGLDAPQLDRPVGPQNTLVREGEQPTRRDHYEHRVRRETSPL